MNKKKYRLISLLILVILISVFSFGCGNKLSQKKVQKNFDNFLYDLFVEEVQSDSLSLNYSLSQPDKFGIRNTDVSLGTVSANQIKESLSITEQYLETLNSFDYDSLTKDQQLTFDITKNYLQSALELGQYPYYNEYLGPSTGVQAQLPILLAEYNFYEKEDIERYLELLPCVYDYFEDLAQFQREKSAQGLFMSDHVADTIIDQCKSFINNPKENFLITYFEEKIDQYENLTEEEVLSYKEANKDGVINYIIPAYKMLITCLQDLKGTGTNNRGLYYFPEGKNYYESLAKFKTGSHKSMEEMTSMLESSIADALLQVSNLAATDPLLIDKYMAFQSFPITEPDDILADLRNNISEDFPDLVSVECEIKYVHESLEEYLSPALYLVPALDDYTNNNIYINGNDEENLSMIYTTIAHEGYPGHLYQCVYFRNQNPAPIRTLMNFMGYDEGWATYVEMYSYHLAGIDENLAEFLSINNSAILCMYARTDIGIHYEGWSKKNAVAYMEHFFGDKTIAEAVYYTLLEEPGIYLPYAIGYLEILELKAKAEEKLDDDFDTKDFHKFVLDIGPAQFDIIDDHLDSWIDTNKDH